MKSNQQVAPVIDLEANRVVFTISDGGEPLVLDMSKVSEAVRIRAAMVGMAQVRIVDAAAISAEDPDDGHIRSAAERMELKRERMAALIAHYETGTEEWKRTGGGEGGAKSLTIEAIANLAYGGAYDLAEGAVDKLAEKKGKTRAKLLADFRNDDPVVSAEMKRIRDSRPKKTPKVSATDLLGELG